MSSLPFASEPVMLTNQVLRGICNVRLRFSTLPKGLSNRNWACKSLLKILSSYFALYKFTKPENLTFKIQNQVIMIAMLTIPLQNPTVFWAKFQTLLSHRKSLFHQIHPFCYIFISTKHCDFCILDEDFPPAYKMV